MQCRWAGCTASTRKGRYCESHEKESIAQKLSILTVMFRARTPLVAIAKTQSRKEIEVKPPRGIADDKRDRLEREQQKINDDLDRKCGYGNGAPRALSPEEIADLAPDITPVEQVSDGSGGKRKRRGKALTQIPTVMAFGKHNGMEIKDVPAAYKLWLLKQRDVDPYLRKALTA